MAKSIHFNLRHVSTGRPVAYCHTADILDHVSSDHREVTCGMCCDFLEGFSSDAQTSPAPRGFGAFGFIAIAAAIVAGFAAIAKAF